MCKQQSLQQHHSSIAPPRNRRGSCPASVTSNTSQNVRLDQYQSNCIRSTRRRSLYDPDHDFEWYDLDAIGKSRNNKLDFHAGMVFTTERQILREGVQGNLVCNRPHAARRQSQTRFWADRETREDRVFRVRMRQLEEELDGDLSSQSLSSGSSHSTSSSSSFW